MSDERGDRSSPDIHDRLPATGARKRWIAPKVIASELSLTAASNKPPNEAALPHDPKNSAPTSG